MADVVTITITMDEAGRINVNGPLENRVMMYGLLAIAQETVSEYNKKKASGIVAPPPGFTLPSVKPS